MIGAAGCKVRRSSISGRFATETGKIAQKCASEEKTKSAETYY